MFVEAEEGVPWSVSDVVAKLGAVRAVAREPQEDFGWCLTFRVPDGRHCVVLGFRPDDDMSGQWIASVERERGFLGSVLGRRRVGIATEAVMAVHHALQAPQIAQVRWHEHAQFDAGHEELGSATP